FDVAATETPARAAKEIDIAVSDTSATAGVTPLTTVDLKSGADKQSFALTKPGTGRFIKLTIKTNHGDAEYNELMEFRALGKPLTKTPLPTGLSGPPGGEGCGG